MRLIFTKIHFLFFSLLLSFSCIAGSKFYLVEDIKNLNLYLWGGASVKDRMLIGYDLLGGMDFNGVTGVICGGVGGGSSYLWIADVKNGVKKVLFPPKDVLSVVASMNNTIVSTNDGRCIISDEENIYSYSLNSPVTKILFSGTKTENSEKPRRVFFNDESNKVIALFDKHFSVLSKSMNSNKLIEAHFPQGASYSLKSLGNFATLSKSGTLLYVSAYILDKDENVVPAIVLINTKDGVVNKFILPEVDGGEYKAGQFYIFGDGNEIAVLLEGHTKPTWYMLSTETVPKNNAEDDHDDYKLIFNKYKAGLSASQLPNGVDYFYAVTTDKGDLIKINLSGDADVTSFDVKGEHNRAVTVSHGDGSYPLAAPKTLMPKKGDAVKVLGDYMICKDSGNSPDEKNCGSARSGVDAIVQDVRTFETRDFVKISQKNKPDSFFWTVIENVQVSN